MRRVHLALVLAALLPVAAQAEPIVVSVASADGGFTQSGTTVGDLSIDLGTITMPGGAVGTIAFEGLHVWSNYTVSFDLEGVGSWDSLRLEILNPVDSGDDALDPPGQPDYIPAGYSTSNNSDGFSFAQDSALARSAVFAGGAASLVADEKTHRGDILLFSGLQGADSARVTFGLRDSAGGRSFLVLFSVLGGDSAAAPEPASMLLIGTGLVGLAGVFRLRARRASSGGSGA